MRFGGSPEIVTKSYDMISRQTLFEEKLTRQLFSFTVCLPDSILAFHKHGMQGRSLRNGEITQEINDPSRVYRLIGSDK